MSKKKIGREFVKLAIELPAAYGTGYLVGTVLAAIVPGGAKIPVKVCCYMGGLIISEVLVEQECKYVDNLVDTVGDAIDNVKAAKNAVNELKEEG